MIIQYQERCVIQWRDIIGKVTATDGGLVYFTTPHGTTIRMGWLAFVKDRRPVQDRAKAAEYIKDARSTGGAFTKYLDGKP